MQQEGALDAGYTRKPRVYENVIAVEGQQSLACVHDRRTGKALRFARSQIDEHIVDDARRTRLPVDSWSQRSLDHSRSGIVSINATVSVARVAKQGLDPGTRARLSAR
jgi:hypothetical protein